MVITILLPLDGERAPCRHHGAHKTMTCMSAARELCVRAMMELDQSCSVLREYGSEQSLLSKPDGSSTFVQGIYLRFVTDLFLYSERLVACQAKECPAVGLIHSYL